MLEENEIECPETLSGGSHSNTSKKRQQKRKSNTKNSYNLYETFNTRALNAHKKKLKQARVEMLC